MFIKENENLPPNIIWLEENKAKLILNCFPEISRRITNGITEIAFVDSDKLRDKIKELKVSC